MPHAQVWRALDALAERKGLTASGLARAAGLDPTTFNKSKRQGRDGKLRWPSTESVSRAIAAAQSSWDEFAALLAGRSGGAGQAIPMVAMAQAGADGCFDAHGFPVGADARVHFPGLGDARVFALEIAGEAMAPVFRAGDVIIVQPGAAVRRGDRVVVRTHDGEVMAKLLGRRNAQVTELVSLNGVLATREVANSNIDWIARIVWASQ